MEYYTGGGGDFGISLISVMLLQGMEGGGGGSILQKVIVNLSARCNVVFVQRAQFSHSPDNCKYDLSAERWEFWVNGYWRISLEWWCISL